MDADYSRYYGKRIRNSSKSAKRGRFGAAIIALIGLGELKSFADAKTFVVESKKYRPNPKNKYIYDELFKSYKQIYYSLEKTYRKANSKRFEGEE